jgi:hypothetical protein
MIMIVAIGIHYYIFYYKPTHKKVSETLSNMYISPSTPSPPLTKKHIVKQIDEIPSPEIEMNINQTETNNYRPNVNILDNRHNMTKKYNNIMVNHTNEMVPQLQKLSLCTYTPWNDFVHQNDSPYEPSGSNQTMNYMSSQFLNDNLNQASFFKFSPTKNRIVYIDTHSRKIPNI